MTAATAPTQATIASGPLTAGDLGLKVLLCESVDGSEGQVSFLPIIAWVTLTESVDGTPGAETWSWQPVVVFEHELRLARTVPHYRGTVAKDVIGKVALGLVKSRFATARDLRRSHSPIWNSYLSGS
ncbi:MAG TPA: hypothetical protein VMH40_01165 [Myxococcaceae bacterium]|nr:hypothetical protein [Myxococcaceae bacterium]